MIKPIYISSYPTLYQLPEKTPLILCHPFIKHQMERQGLSTDLIKVVPTEFPKNQTIEQDLSIILGKHDKYLELLIPRLNKIHSNNFSQTFWKRSLGIGFERLITICYEAFIIHSQELEPSKHTFHTLNYNNFHTPVDFDEVRWFCDHNPQGKEQLFSQFCISNEIKNGVQYSNPYHSTYQIRNYGKPTPYNPKVGILGAWFSPKYNIQLQKTSHNQVQQIGYSRNFNLSKRINIQNRLELSKHEVSFDSFDQYFFDCLKFLFPFSLLEDFNSVYQSIDSNFERLTNLKYVVSEMWIGDSIEAIATGILFEKNVQLIYNEHNYNEHHFKSNFTNRWSNLCDHYIAHGNYAPLTPNMHSLGSLYEFNLEEKPKYQADKITYISNIIDASTSQISHSSACNTNADIDAYFDFKLKFFKKISAKIKNKLSYRRYPIDDYLKFFNYYYDDQFIMKESLEGIELDPLSHSGKWEIASSKLVIIDYTLTSHLESLSMNIPTIILKTFSDTSFTYAFQKEFDELIQNNICFDCPIKAVKFIETIAEDPNEWWNKPSVQTAKNNFLKRNLGEPQLFIEYLLNLVKD